MRMETSVEEIEGEDGKRSENQRVEEYGTKD